MKYYLNRPYPEALVKSIIGDQTAERLGRNIPQYLCHKERNAPGIFLGYVYKNGQINYAVKPPDRGSHVIAIAETGGGKTSCFVIPTIRGWSGTVFAIDIKGDLLKNTQGQLNSQYPTKVFSFSEDTKYSRYDPINLLRNGDPNDLVQNARELAEAIIQISSEERDKFWKKAARNVLTAVILYMCDYEEKDKDGNVLKGSFNKAVTMIQSEPIWSIISEICSSENKVAAMFVNQYNGIAHPEESKMLADISAELSNSVMTFATDNRIKASFTESDKMFSWEDLKDHNVFMEISEDRLDQLSEAITMMLNQMVRTLERRPDKHSSDYNLPPVLIVLDEFPRLGKMEVIFNAISTLRSKGVTFCLVVQSLAQLDHTYGREGRQIIVDNCPYKVIMNVNDPESQKLLSDMVGTINVQKNTISSSLGKSVGANGGFSIGTTGFSLSGGGSLSTSQGVSISASTVREPIIFPHEFATLKDIVLLTPEGFCRVNKLPYYDSPKEPYNQNNLPAQAPARPALTSKVPTRPKVDNKVQTRPELVCKVPTRPVRR